MGKRRCKARILNERALLLVFYLFFFVLDEVALVAVIFLIVVIVFGDDIQVHWMYLGDFEFGFALWAAQDFALLYFVFVDVNFCGTLGAANHGSILRRIVGRCVAGLRGRDK